MKYIIITFTICLFIPIQMSSQTRIGVKLGGQLSGLNDIHFASKVRMPGLNIGGLLSIPLQNGNDLSQKTFFLNVELLYSQEGESEGEAPEDWLENGYTGYHKFYQDYINMPVMLRMHITNYHPLFFEIGPQFGYLIYERDSKTDKEFYGEINKFNLSLSLGGGVSFGRNYQYEISGRLNWGLLDLYSWIGINYTAVAGVSFGYFF